MKKLFIIFLCLGLVGCATATVRQQDIDSWVGVPVEALDTHSFFITVPMIRTITDSGIEIRNYANGMNLSRCAGGAGGTGVGNFVSVNAFSNCASGWYGCNNLFYIKDGKVVEYVPRGQCYTDETVQPEPRYLRLQEFRTGSR